MGLQKVLLYMVTLYYGRILAMEMPISTYMVSPLIKRFTVLIAFCHKSIFESLSKIKIFSNTSCVFNIPKSLMIHLYYKILNLSSHILSA